MTSARSLMVFAFLCVGGMGMALHAGPDFMQDDGPVFSSSAQRDRKTVRWYALLRTRADTPDEQLAYADRLREAGRLRRAGRAYNALVHRWHQHDEAIDAQRRLAVLLFDRGRYEKSFNEFQYLIKHFAGLFPYEEALTYQFRIVNQMLEPSRRRLWGARDPARALPLLDQVIANAPAHEDVPAAWMRIGDIHERGKDYEQAVLAYEQLLQRYPRAPESKHAAFRRAVCLARISRRAPRDEAQARAALSAFSAFLNRHPQTAYTSDAHALKTELLERLADRHYEIAEFYDRRARRPEAAIIAYRDFIHKFPGDARRAAVVSRLHELDADERP